MGGPAFLSPEWLEALGQRVSRAVPEGAVPLRLGVVVTGGPNGEVSYTLMLGGSGSGAEPGAEGSSLVVGTVEEAEVVMVESYADAEALAAGTVSASRLLEGGRIKLRGDANRLLAAADTLRAVGEAFGTVRSAP